MTEGTTPKVLDPAKRVPQLRYRTDSDGNSWCGICGSAIAGDESGLESTGLIDDSSADVRDYRALGVSYVVFWPCGHHQKGGLVRMGTP